MEFHSWGGTGEGLGLIKTHDLGLVNNGFLCFRECIIMIICTVIVQVLVNWLNNLIKARQLRSVSPCACLEEVHRLNAFPVYDVEAIGTFIKFYLIKTQHNVTV